MLRTVLKYVLIGMVLLVIIGWLWSGGWRGVTSFVRTIPNPLDILFGTSTSTYEVRLPWAIGVPQGPDIELYLNEGAASYDAGTPEEQLAELESAYKTLQEEVAKQARSPHAGKVKLYRASATESSASDEHVVLEAHSGVSLQGWSLASMVSGVRVMLPYATPLYRQNSVNTAYPVVMEPGTTAIVATGFSPAGVSLRENRCMGYLSSSLNFSPRIEHSCPSPSDGMALTDQNLQRYGGECIDYVRTMPQCTTPSTIPASLSAACRIYVANTFTYNGCIDAHRAQSGFESDTWRLYIGSAGEIWRNEHDAIRLLDERGLTVDAIIY